MLKSILIGLLLMISTSAIAHHSVIHNHAIQAGGSNCSYQCQQAQQEIQYLLNAIYWEQRKPRPNWAAIRQAEQRINQLRRIR